MAVNIANAPRPALPGRLVLLGHPVAHSLSPTFQNAALDAAQIALRYDALDVMPAALQSTLAELRAVNGAGNVTVPHKPAVAAACDALTDVARAAGAVNTFWHVDDRLIGDNTDVAGAQAALAALPLAPLSGSSPRVTLLGAGGAARAVILAAERLWPNVRVRVLARRVASAHELAAAFPHRVEIANARTDALLDADLVINATPLGLRQDDPLPCDMSELAPTATLYDLVYGARETAWVRAGRAAGHRAEDGLGMLVEQGAAAFTRWFGIEPDRDRMWQAVEARTGRGRSSKHPQRP